MEKGNNIPKNKKHFEKDETLQAIKKYKKQRQIEEENIEIEEMLEELDDSIYYMLKKIK